MIQIIFIFIIAKMIEFYDQLDVVFDKLYEMYGFNHDIMQYKSDIIKIYEKERGYRYHCVIQSTKDIHWHIDDQGYIRSIAK